MMILSAIQVILLRIYLILLDFDGFPGQQGVRAHMGHLLKKDFLFAGGKSGYSFML
jgi:hypothetical protein